MVEEEKCLQCTFLSYMMCEAFSYSYLLRCNLLIQFEACRKVDLIHYLIITIP